MVDEHIKKYVKERLKSGVPRSHIEEILSIMGLSKEEIVDAFQGSTTIASKGIEDSFVTSLEAGSESKSNLMESKPKPFGSSETTVPKAEEKPLVEPEEPLVEPTKPEQKPKNIIQPVEMPKPIVEKSAGVTPPVVEQPKMASPEPQPISEPLEKPTIEPLAETVARKARESMREESAGKTLKEQTFIQEPKLEGTPTLQPETVPKVEETLSPVSQPVVQSTKEETSETSRPISPFAKGIVEYINKDEKTPVKVSPVTPTKQFAGYKPVEVTKPAPETTPQVREQTPPTQTATPTEPKTLVTTQQAKPIVQTPWPKQEPKQPEAPKSEPKKKFPTKLLLMAIVLAIVIIGGGVGAFILFGQPTKDNTPPVQKPTIGLKGISVNCDAVDGKLIIKNQGDLPIEPQADGLTIMVAGNTYEDTSNTPIPPGGTSEYTRSKVADLSPGIEGVVFGKNIPVTNFNC